MPNAHGDVLSAEPSNEESRIKLSEELRRRGNAAFKSKSFPEACLLYSRGLELCPTDAVLYANRSAARAGMGEFKLALEDAQEAVKIKGDWAKGYFRVGKAFAGLKDWKRAHEAYVAALRIEPSNSAAKKEAEKSMELFRNASKDEKKPTAKTEKKPPSTTPMVNNANTSSVKKTVEKSKPAASSKSTEDMRGYKILEDGRQTSFFHREYSEEALKLMGDHTPKALDAIAAQKLLDEQAKLQGASAWNVKGTFEERDMTNWAKNRIEELVAAVSEEFQGYTFNLGKLVDFEGDAAVSMIRGSKRRIFDFTFSVKWTATGPSELEGKMFVPEFSSDQAGDSQYDVELRWEGRSKVANSLASDISRFIRGPLKKKLDTQLVCFSEQYMNMQ